AIRERQWLDRLPTPVRNEVLSLPEAKRPARIAELRREERQMRHEWTRPARPRAGGAPARPTKLQDFPLDVQQFLTLTLTPYLSAQEQEQPRQAEGKWPLLARTILKLADEHPILPPPAGRKGVTRFRGLPLDLQTALPRALLVKLNQWQKLKEK